MAGLEGSNVDFSILGDLPNVARAAQDRQLLKSTLADLSSTDPDSLEKKAAQLIASGNLEAGLKLQQAALARRTLTQKSAADEAYLKAVGGFKWPGAPTPPSQQTPDTGPAITLTPKPPSAAPDPFAGPAGAIPGVGPRSDIPGPPQQAAEAPLSPSDQLIQAAQAGAAPAGPQLAGPPPTPNTLGPPPVPGREVFQPPGPVPPMAPPQAPPQVAQAPGAEKPPPSLPAYQADAQAEAEAVGQALTQFPRTAANAPLVKALLDRFRAATSKLKLTPEQQSWQEERISRAREGKPDISFGEYQTQLKAAPERIKEVGKLYVDQEKKSAQSGELVSTLNRMEQITKDPNFISGANATAYAEAVNKLSSLARIAGVDPEEIKGRLGSIIQPHLRAAALVQEFTSLSNAALMAHVGSFSKSFSDADRAFVEKIFPQIIQTPGGIQRIMANLKEMAEHGKGASKAVRQYMKDNDLKVTEHGYFEALNDYGDKNPLFVNPDGSLTDKGKQIEGAAKPSSAGGKVMFQGPGGLTAGSEAEAWDAYRKAGGT